MQTQEWTRMDSSDLSDGLLAQHTLAGDQDAFAVLVRPSYCAMQDNAVFPRLPRCSIFTKQLPRRMYIVQNRSYAQH